MTDVVPGGATAVEAGVRQWPGAAILLTKSPRTDLTPYAGVRVFVTDSDDVVHELTTSAGGAWQLRLDDAGLVVIDLTDADGIPILWGQPVTLSSTNLTPWPSADLTIPTEGLTDVVDVIVEGRSAR